MERRWLQARKRMSRPKKPRGKTKQTIHIYCEGEKTEPEYFEYLKKRVKLNVKVSGEGYNTLSLVKLVLTKIKSLDLKKKDQVWCVFDKDSFSDEVFLEAIALANENNIKCAYTNEAFELWYLLHFIFTDSALSRTQYEPKLTKILGFDYKKNDPKVPEKLFEHTNNAIKNAITLMSRYRSTNVVPTNNPVTTVHELVQVLYSQVKQD